MEALKEAQEKREIKSQRLILDVVKDHLIPHVSKKTNKKDMIDSLVSLFKSDNMYINIFLRNKLREVWMTKSDNVISYLIRIT